MPWSGPTITELSYGRGPGDYGRSRAMSRARQDQERFATMFSVLGGAPGMQPAHVGNRIAARDRGDAANAAEVEEIWNDPTLTLENRMNAGWNLRHGRQKMSMGGWGDFFDSLQGKDVDWGGFGFDAALDVPSGKIYRGGEVAPGLRPSLNDMGSEYGWDKGYRTALAEQQGLSPGKRGWYTPGEYGGLGKRQRGKA